MQSIGEILLEISELDQASLDRALALQQEKGGRIGEILLQQKAIQDVDLARAVSRQLDLEFTQSLPSDINTDFTDQVPIHFLKKFKMIPLASSDGNRLVVYDPFLFQAQDDLCQILGWDDVKIVVGPLNAIINAIGFAYDINIKTPLYARQNVPEVWVINLIDKCVHVFENPIDGAYQNNKEVKSGKLTPTRIASVILDLESLWNN